ncbi:uncharacterized protein LOC117766218 [Hippoglossus hippoglossus]|uniref:uncharacterized protein LOC117766218 n=1 Tax=Hippoglossus hippoglossus TaxID=8267 RepID=UPI00148CB8A1|nr:uncharacterized protein LOC117766218 [Hippoglossus hippoglossus]
MHVKQTGNWLSFLLSITIITFPSVSWCESAHSAGTRPPAGPRGARGRAATPRGPQHLHQQLLHLLHSSDRRPAARTTSPDTRFRHNPNQSEGQRVYSSPPPPDEDCATAQIQHTAPGRFYIVGRLEANIPNAGYQADSAAAAVQAEGHQEKVRGQWLSSSEESWQKLQPVVECGADAMILVVRRRRAGNLLLDRVNQSSVPLSQLKPQCGYSVQTTWRDLSLMAQYDACHVTQEDDSYVLPLLWRGAPVKMLCPVPQIQPHAQGQYSVCCSPYGMTVNLQGPTPAEQLSINVRGEWTPLVSLAEQCGFTVERRDAEILIAAPYMTCGMTVKDGKYTLYLQIGENRLLLSCPVSSLEELPGTRLVDGPHFSRIRTEPPSEPFPWAAPFYLAPLYYPHPTYQQEYREPDAPDVHNPLTPLFSTPDPNFGPQPLPTVDSQYPEYYSHQIPDWDSNNQHAVHVPLSSTHEMEDLSLVHPDLQQKQGPPVLDLSETHSPFSAAASQAEAPSLQPPNHAFNPYYHYYHHPKIPLSDPPQDPDAAPEVPEELSPTNTYEFLVWPPKAQQSEAKSDPSPPPQVASHPYIPPGPEVDHKTPASYPYPYPHHYFYYFPHMARGEAKRLTPPHRDMATETNVPDVQPLPESSERPVHEEHNVSPYETKKYRPDWIRIPLLSEDDGVTQELNDEEQHSAPATPALPPSNTPEPDPVPPPHPYLYAPYYHYYQMYSGPDHDRASPTSSKDAADPLLQASSSPAQHQTTSSPTESTYPAQNGHLYPYFYYYHHLLQPEESKDEQEPHPAGSTDSEIPSSESESLLPSDSDHSRTDLYAEAGNPSFPQPPHSPLHGLYSQQHLYYAVGPPGGEEAEERLDSDTTDHPEANTPSPCGLGPASTSNCSHSLGCCSYPVEDCTMGQHFVFVVPDSVSEPTVPPAAHPSEDSEASCVLRRLTSDPEVYTVPLDGCGVNKLMFGQTVVHLLEVQGIYSPPDDRTSDNEDSPVRLLVECSSSPGSPGEVRLHVMDQPPPPPPPIQSVTVQLRLSTDELFSSFHPEAHLPLSLVRGRPLYLEVSLLEPPEENLVLLVQSCMAHTAAPYTGWMHIYDGCPGRDESQLLPSPDPHRTRRIMISGFLFLPPQSPSYMAAGGHSLLGDPEIFICCSTEVCSAADGDCTSGCIDSPNGGM